MRSPVLCTLCSSIVALSGVCTAQGQVVLPQAPPPTETAYRGVDQIEGSVIDLAFAPVRPMVLTPPSDLYAVNTHGSTVVHFNGQMQLVQTFPVAWGPVSIAYWDNLEIPNDQFGGEQLLVVCKGSQVLQRLDRQTGTVLKQFTLHSEPADILVYETSNRAFVTCAGTDEVFVIDLMTNTLIAVHTLPSRQPTFMSFTRPQNAADHRRVLITPLLSGNDSTVDSPEPSTTFAPGPGRIINLDTSMSGRLPDQDVFMLDPEASTIAPIPLARGMGTVLFAHDTNPSTGALWVLNTEANNKPTSTSPNVGLSNLQGRFSVNRLSIAALNLPSGPIVGPSSPIDLDLCPDPNDVLGCRAVGQPCALAFDSFGNGYIAGMLSKGFDPVDHSRIDVVTKWSSAGTFLTSWRVGAIPRALLVQPVTNRILVYCWGSNTVEIYRTNTTTPQLIGSALSLGYDPTPPAEKDGRLLWFSAELSQNRNGACATCHPDGRGDAIGWDLSDLNGDDKGPLVTQSLRGIEGLLNYHWRGEQTDLEDFNDAFDKLLGARNPDGTPRVMPAADFAKLKAYTFFLHNPANPDEHPRRVLRSNYLGVNPSPNVASTSNPVRGQDLFFNALSVPAGSPTLTCADCHSNGLTGSLQIGTASSSEILRDEGHVGIPRRSHFKVAPLITGMWLKEPRGLITNLPLGSDTTRPVLGFGFAASGLADTMRDFISNTALQGADADDVTAFSLAIDSGLAPAVHACFLLGPGANITQTYNQISNFLLVQAQARNCDIAVFGDVQVGGPTRSLRWFWDRTLSTPAFVCEDSLVGARSLTFFRDEALAGRSNTFVGLPVGMGERWGVDYDNDDLFNLDEPATLTQPDAPHNPDVDGDGDPDGHEAKNGGAATDPTRQSMDSAQPAVSNVRILDVTTRSAKILFDSNEPTRARVTAFGSAVLAPLTSYWEKKHMLFLRNLQPGTAYPSTLRVFDISGNLTSVPISGLTTRSLLDPNDLVLASIPAPVVSVNSNTTLSFMVTATATNRNGTPQSNKQLEGDVYKKSGSTITVLQSGVLSTISGANGQMAIYVTGGGLLLNDELRLNVVTVKDLNNPNQVTQRTHWNMPETAKVDRDISVKYTGTGP